MTVMHCLFMHREIHELSLEHWRSYFRIFNKCKKAESQKSGLFLCSLISRNKWIWFIFEFCYELLYIFETSLVKTPYRNPSTVEYSAGLHKSLRLKGVFPLFSWGQKKIKMGEETKWAVYVLIIKRPINL